MIYINEDGHLVQERDDGMRGLGAQKIQIIERSRAILEEIAPATVRAVCYRLFTEQVIGAMATNETQKVSKALVFARENDLIPWEWIVDETRRIEKASAWNDLSSYGRAVIQSYRKDFWTQQPGRSLVREGHRARIARACAGRVRRWLPGHARLWRCDLGL
jgi:hypothetical protein